MLEWDGADYLYASDYNNDARRFARIRIPADPMVAASWGAWETLPVAPGGGLASGVMAFVDARPKPYQVVGYRPTGTIKAQFAAPAGTTSWGSLEWVGEQPADTAISLKVQGGNGTTFVDLPGLTAISGPIADLSGVSVSAYPQLRLTATLSSTSPASQAPVVTPRLTSWSVTAVRGVTRAAKDGTSVASLGCSSCHNTHGVRAGAGPWDTSRVSDPSATGRVWASGTAPDMTSFCLACHSGATVSRSTKAGSMVPYDVRLRDGAGAFFPGWAKDLGSTSFAGSGHYTTTGTKALCQTCHDPHGSVNARLTAWTRPSSWTTGVAGTRDNTSTAAFEQNLCYQCHGNDVVGRRAPGAQDVASAASGLYRHPVGDVAGAHADTEGALGVGAASRHSECTDCHDPHAARPGVHVAGSSRSGGAVRGALGVKPTWSVTSALFEPATSYTPARLDGGSADVEAYLCLKCHNAGAQPGVVTRSNGTTYTPTDLSKEFNPANPSYHDVLGTGRGVLTLFAVGGTNYSWPWNGDSAMVNGWTRNSKMTCTDCHTGGSVGQARGPHGSSAKYMLDPVYPADWETTQIDMAKSNGMSQNTICAKCHVVPADAVHGHVQHRQTECVVCHVRVPHGWKRPRLLGYSTDPVPYRSVLLLGVALRSRPGGEWALSDCSASGGCSGQHPSRVDTDYWP